jgi:hypothetical protein
MIFMTTPLSNGGSAGRTAALTACRRWLTFSPTSEEKARGDRLAVAATWKNYSFIFSKIQLFLAIAGGSEGRPGRTPNIRLR